MPSQNDPKMQGANETQDQNTELNEREMEGLKGRKKKKKEDFIHNIDERQF